MALPSRCILFNPSRFVLGYILELCVLVQPKPRNRYHRSKFRIKNLTSLVTVWGLKPSFLKYPVVDLEAGELV